MPTEYATAWRSHHRCMRKLEFCLLKQNNNITATPLTRSTQRDTEIASIRCARWRPAPSKDPSALFFKTTETVLASAKGRNPSRRVGRISVSLRVLRAEVLQFRSSAVDLNVGGLRRNEGTPGIL